MEKHLAKKAVRIAVEFDGKIAELYDFADHIKDHSERKRLKDCANLIMGIINRDIINPILELYPDIDPDI